MNLRRLIGKMTHSRIMKVVTIATTPIGTKPIVSNGQAIPRP